MKLLTASVLTLLLCGIAAAQPSPTTTTTSTPPAPRTVGPAKMFELTLAHDNDVRTYRVLVNVGDCGDVSSDDRDRSDEVSVCVEQAANGIALRTNWKLRDGTFKYQSRWNAVVSPGAKVDLGSAGSVRLALTMK